MYKQKEKMSRLPSGARDIVDSDAQRPIQGLGAREACGAGRAGYRAASRSAAAASSAACSAAASVRSRAASAASAASSARGTVPLMASCRAAATRAQPPPPPRAWRRRMLGWRDLAWGGQVKRGLMW
jgi:hypothetical protein